jgi:hypothetical protein
MADSDKRGVKSLIESVADERRRTDASNLLELMRDATGEEPRLWSSDTIGFGRYHYRYKTGQEGDFFSVGFSPRKDRLTLYIMSGLRGFEDILERLGPHKAGMSTVHVRRLGDVDRPVLIELIEECVKHLRGVETSMGAIPRLRDIPPRKPGDQR